MKNFKERTLILLEKDITNEYLFEYWNKNGFSASTIFKKQNKFSRGMRRFLLKFDLFVPLYVDKWKDSIQSYDYIIIFCSRLTKCIPKYVHSLYPNIKIIYWYWNTVDDTNRYIPDDCNIELWTFDDEDSKSYKIKKNIQFYCLEDNNESNFDSNRYKSDIFFVGRDKGRSTIIDEIRKIAEKNNLVCDFTVLLETEKAIPYRDIQNSLRKTRSILEINKDKQSGLTLRAMESLFYEKKLITNNISIKEAEFYFPENIFILKYDDINKIKEFLESPYNHSADKFKQKYNVDKWFSNFFD